MLEFTNRAPRPPDKRDPAERARDHAEIDRGFRAPGAAAQAERCSQCGVPFCSVHCPLGNHIPDWLKLAAENRLEEAYELSASTNNFPEICGRICPQDRLCEGNCVIEPGFGAVTIGAVERFVTDHAWEQGWVRPPTPRAERPGSVGIVGAGPAGLAAAEQLRLQGWQVHVYDRHDRAGGLLIYGIPGFKLEKPVVLRRWRLLEQSGIRFHLQQAIGDTLSFEALRARHDAILIATGVYQPRDAALPGADLPGVVPALPYLTQSNRIGLGDVLDSPVSAAGRQVVVIGGGDTAMDCARTALRQGAASVTCLYRRDRANMPGSAREVRHAEEEGVRFRWLAAPEAYLGEAHLTGIRARAMRLGLPDAAGRASVEPVPDGGVALPADLAIEALGFDPEPLPALWRQPELAVSRWGTLRTDPASFMTSMPGVFAAGDIVRGASLVVWAIRDGRDAAARMHEWLADKARARAA